MLPPPPAHPTRRFHFGWLILAAILAYIVYAIYDYKRPASSFHPTIKDPNGRWVGQITLDGRYYRAASDGDTPGQHRFAVVSFSLETTDSFLGDHAGDGTLRIAGEGITRPIRASGWEVDPDGTVRLEFGSSPQILQSTFTCEAEGTKLTCKSDDAMKPRLTLHPGTKDEANALYAQALHSEATEPALTPLPHVESMQEFEDRMHRDDAETDRELGRTTANSTTQTRSHRRTYPK